MSFIDRVKGLFKETPRSKALRIIRAGYDASKTTRHNENYYAEATNGSADAEASPYVREILRGRARYEYQNNTYCRGILDTKARYVLGTIPRLQVKTNNAGLNRLLETRFNAWANSVALGKKLRRSHVSKMRDGDGLLIAQTNPENSDPVKLDIRVIDPARLASPFNVGQDPLLFDGIRYDQFGNPVEYYIYKTNVNQIYFSPTEYTAVSADQVIHIYSEVLPEQHRGVPDITPALLLFGDMRQYTAAIIRSAKNAASFSGVLESDLPPDADELTMADLATVAYEMDALLTLPSGYKMKQLEVGQSGQQYADVKREMINEIARCLDMPLNIALANSSGYNYSSGQLDHGSFQQSLREDRFDLINSVLDRIFKWWFEEASTIDGYIPPLDELPRHSWMFDGFIHGDPVKDANAAKIRLEAGITSKTYESGQLGLDFEDVALEIANDTSVLNEANDQYGVSNENQNDTQNA